jgi:methylisocitrate lyase
MMTTKTRRLREILQRPGPLVLPGSYDPLSAKLVEQAGFEAVYMTGGGTAPAVTGLPDIGVLTLTEMAQNAKYISNAVGIPVIADADTGYGNAMNVIRTVQEYEQAGVAGLHIEDQITAKRCGHVNGKECIPADEMVGKIRAAVDARRDPDLMIIARTDARSPLGFEESVRRSLLYVDAGADMVFADGLESREEFKEYSDRVPGPLLADMTEFGKSPYLTVNDFAQLGYKVVVFPVSTLRIALRAMQDFLRELQKLGTQAPMLDQMMTRAELYDLIGYADYTAAEAKYLGTGIPPI